MHEAFPLLTPESAPESARDTLSAIESRYGFIPNLARAMAASPVTLTGYLTLYQALESDDAELSEIERQAVIVAISVANGCDYCSTAHAMLARKAGLSDGDSAALLAGADPADDRLAVLARYARSVIADRGHVPRALQLALTDAGFSPAVMLEIVGLAGFKLISNYINHLVGTPLNPEFREAA